MIRRASLFPLLALLIVARSAVAHPMVEDALDIVISQNRITIIAKVSPEEIVTENQLPPSAQPDAQAVKNHGNYVLHHLRVEVDNQPIVGHEVPSPSTTTPTYRFEYPLMRPPQILRLYQTILIDRPPWTVSCVVRFRQNNQSEFDTALLTREATAEFQCDWPSASQPATSQPATQTAIRAWPTFRAYAIHGVMHILTGYDHLLFVAALVLAATSLLDLIKVVTAFTLAHTITLALSVFNIVTLSEHIVEPMIAFSILAVALQNIFWPRTSRGWPRLAIAFAFGLFHGLGFAGGLKDAMIDLPRSALWLSLIAFSLGVEIGHQVVVLPLFGALTALRPKTGRNPLLKIGSAAIAAGGAFFLLQAFKR